MVAAVVATVLASGCSLKEVQTWFALRGHSITAQQAKDIADKVNAQSSAGCDANYADFCVPNNQTSVRCAGTDGAGPEIGPVRIVGWDHFGLDPDGDKRACESPPSATPTPVVSAPTAPPTAPPPLPTTPAPTSTAPPGPIPSTGTSFMYVAASDADVIRKIDTVTLDVVATYDVGGPLGDGLAMIGTRLFYGAGDRQFMTIGMYDIATGENNRSYIGGVYEPLLRTSPALPGRLVVATTHTSPSTLYLYDVTGDSGVRLRQSSPHGAIGGNLKEVEISADGTRIWTAAGAPYVISEVRTSDLTLSGGSFETGAYPTATASAIVGGTELVAAGTAYNRTAFVFNAASRELLTNTPIPGETADRGLQFSRDGSKLYAAVEAGASADLVTIDRATSRVATAPMFGTTLSDLYFDMGELAVDPGTGRVFVTAHDAISVYNPDGTYGRTLSQRGPRSMAFSATGPTSTPPTLVPTSLPNAGPPVISRFDASHSSGPAPLTTAWQWTISDPDGSPLICSLDLDGNGVVESTISPCTSAAMRTITYTTAGERTARLYVSDGELTTSDGTLVRVFEPSADPFDITIRPNGSMTSSQLAAFTAAAQRWARVIRTGLPDGTVAVEADECDDGAPAYTGPVDDLVIEAIITPIDGPDGILGAAGPCLVRSSGGLPAYGIMQFDSADVAMLEADGSFTTVVLHEMAHVLGFGSVAGWRAILDGAGTANPTFDGAVARAAWSMIGGGSASVPVEGLGGPGTAGGHWRESVLDNELMTGWLNEGPNPLSTVTVGAMADLGYGVDLAGADSYGSAVSAFRALFTPSRKIDVELLSPLDRTI